MQRHQKDPVVTVMGMAANEARRAELAEALNRALNTWEGHPRWLMDLADQFESISKEPTNPAMTQGAARCIRTAKLRVDVTAGDGHVLPAGSWVPVEWESSYRVLPEGHPDSRLVHEFAIREYLRLGHLGRWQPGQILAVVPDYLLSDLLPQA